MTRHACVHCAKGSEKNKFPQPADAARRPNLHLRSNAMQEKIRSVLRKIAQGTGRITALTGAGISAESGIPTFRGPEGYWTVGSTVYQPQEMATFHMFSLMPDEVWKWYLYRMGVCRRAEPNPGHLALVAMEQQFS